MRVCN